MFNLDRDLPRMASMTEILSPHDADLRPYKNRSGKLLLYHGTSDPAISSYGTVDYYNKVAKIVGGQKDVESFARLYLVPGMHHCGGGPGPNQFDMLTQLENWIEKGVSADGSGRHALDQRCRGPDSPALSLSAGGEVHRHRQRR